MKQFRYLEEESILELSIDRCIGCGNCVEVCPHRVFGLSGKKVTLLDRGACMECGACALNCPTAALYVNPDDGCGCAAYIINSWFARFRGKPSSSCGC
jgi:NAD-dependent dihydropyrimidine dehydrogenase PreA subunit